jgi:hypothetical protein
VAPIRLLLALVLGLFIGAVCGVLIDRVVGFSFLSYPLLSKPYSLSFYIIQIEIQITPASLIGLVVTGYLVIKKG